MTVLNQGVEICFTAFTSLPSLKVIPMMKLLKWLLLWGTRTKARWGMGMGEEFGSVQQLLLGILFCSS
jgi:hypothetical protein